MIERYTDLMVYQRSYALTLEIYEVTKAFPREELFGLTSQMKRAAFSIPLNIAEGYGKRESVKEFKRFLMMALGSSDEMHVILELTKDLGYISKETHEALYTSYTEVGKMLYGLLTKWTKFQVSDD